MVLGCGVGDNGFQKTVIRQEIRHFFLCDLGVPPVFLFRKLGVCTCPREFSPTDESASKSQKPLTFKRYKGATSNSEQKKEPDLLCGNSLRNVSVVRHSHNIILSLQTKSWLDVK